ncbi:MAG: tail fiber domain-containing protein [Candidatus Moraniibacteriota bacterium]
MFSDTGVVTSGIDYTYGTYTSVDRSGATGGTQANYGNYVSLSATTGASGFISNYGQYISVSGNTTGTSAHYGLYVAVSGADTNYAGIFSGGNVGINDATPTALLTVGSGDLFQVNSSGAIAAAAGITSSGTITFSGLSTAGIVTNTSGGVLGTTNTLGVTLGGTGTGTAFTAGSIVFAGASGVYSQDNANFFWDDSNNRLGIGDNTPENALDVETNLASAYAASFFNDGNDANRYGISIQAGLDNAATTNNSKLIQFYDGDGGDLGTISFGKDSGGPSQPAGLRLDSSSILLLGKNTPDTRIGDIAGTVTTESSNYTLSDFGLFLGVGTGGGSQLTVESSSVSGYSGWFKNFDPLEPGDGTDKLGLSITAGDHDGTNATTSTLIDFFDGGDNPVGSITFGSGVTSYNTTSDERLKTNIRNTGIGIDMLKSIQIRDYAWKADASGQTIHGVIAQELAQIYPQAVTVPRNPTDYWMVDYSKLTPLIIKSIQDQQLAIEDNAAQIGRVELKTNRNIQSLSGLQGSVDTQLGLAAAEINTLKSGQATFADQLAGAQALLDQLNTQVTTNTSDITTLESQMESLNDRVSILSDFYTTFELGTFVAANAEGDVDLLQGRLRAAVLETGALAINVEDIDAPTIGSDTILPLINDDDEDGEDDDTQADGKKVFVETKAVTDDSKIFTSFASDPGASTWVEKHKEEGEYDGFTVHLAEPTDKAVKVDWWIVEQK